MRVLRAIPIAWLLAGLALAAAVETPRKLERQQSRARERMQEVERRLVELADLLEAEAPRRARALRRALSESREGFVVQNMEEIESLLGRRDFGPAGTAGEEVLAVLDRINRLLEQSQGGIDLERLLEARSRLAELIRRQREAAVRTGGLPEHSGGPVPRQYAEAARGQSGLRSDLVDLLEGLAGVPGSSEMQEALAAMRRAGEALESARREDAADSQQRAAERMQEAEEKLRNAIRRERERRRAESRRNLAALLERAAEQQAEVRAQTEALHARVGETAATRGQRLQARELAGDQGRVSELLDDALAVLEQDGTTVALPAAIEGIGEDSDAALALLEEARTGAAVQGLQRDVEEALRALMEAVRAEQRERQAERQQPPEQRRRRKGERPMLGALRELKVVRELQGSVNQQTERADRLAAELGHRDELVRGELSRLARKQGRLAEMVRRVDKALGEER